MGESRANGELSLERVNPDVLSSLLKDAGWHLAGERTGVYARFVAPGESFSSENLLIPLDRSAPEYSHMLRAALEALSQHKDLWARRLSPRLTADVSDEFKFRKESAAPSGFISWREGEELVSSARKTLLAGAKSYMEPVRHFSNRFGQFANRYLDSVLMGQSAPGSYVVTAYAPVRNSIPLHGAQATPDLVSSNVADGRSVSLAVAKAVEATSEALDHYRARGSLSGFEYGIANGVSYEMTMALLGIASNADGADITILWDPIVPHSGYSDATTFDFSGGDVPILQRAATALVQDSVAERISIIGRVHLLSRKTAGAPGVFGIDSLLPDGPKKVRVRLESDDEYHEAVRAYEDELAVHVNGVLERQGNLSWLYHAVLVETLAPVDQMAPRTRRGTSDRVGGEVALFSPAELGIDDETDTTEQ